MHNYMERERCQERNMYTVYIEKKTIKDRSHIRDFERSTAVGLRKKKDSTNVQPKYRPFLSFN